MVEPDTLPRRIEWAAVWRWSRWRKIVATVSLLAPLPLYALSIGPAVMLVGADYIDVSTAANMYRPLIRLEDSLPPQFGEFLLRYMCMWGDDSGVMVYLSENLTRKSAIGQELIEDDASDADRHDTRPRYGNCNVVRGPVNHPR